MTKRFKVWDSELMELEADEKLSVEEIKDLSIVVRADEHDDDMRDAAMRLRSLAKDDRLRCRCETTSGYTHHCEPCRALAFAERILTP